MTPHRYTGRADVSHSKGKKMTAESKRDHYLDDGRSIKEWYEDSKKYARQHPIAALLGILSVFFGLTQL